MSETGLLTVSDRAAAAVQRLVAMSYKAVSVAPCWSWHHARDDPRSSRIIPLDAGGNGRSAEDANRRGRDRVSVARATFSSVRVDGGVRPLSNRATADCVVFIRAANSAWVKPARVRASIRRTGQFVYRPY